jgi:hypothetical protein
VDRLADIEDDLYAAVAAAVGEGRAAEVLPVAAGFGPYLLTRGMVERGGRLLESVIEALNAGPAYGSPPRGLAEALG